MLAPDEILAIASAIGDHLDMRMRHARSLCSFCRKHRDDVRLLVAGVDAVICDECIESAAKLLREDLARR